MQKNCVVMKADGKTATHSGVTEVEGVCGQLFLRDANKQPVVSYGDGEWDSWKFEDAE